MLSLILRFIGLFIGATVFFVVISLAVAVGVDVGIKAFLRDVGNGEKTTDKGRTGTDRDFEEEGND